MAFIANPQGNNFSAGATSTALIYAPPPSTVAYSPYSTSLFAPSSAIQPRHIGHTQVRHRQQAPHIVYPEHYHQPYRLPSNIEHQPF